MYYNKVKNLEQEKNYSATRNLNPEPMTAIDNNNMWNTLPFRNCNLSSDWTEYQNSFDSDDSSNDDIIVIVHGKNTYE